MSLIYPIFSFSELPQAYLVFLLMEVIKYFETWNDVTTSVLEEHKHVKSR